jgi:glycine dehydrogenase subunit 1
MKHPYLPLTDANRMSMLHQVGVDSMEDLLTDLPPEERLAHRLNLPPPMSEVELSEYFRKIADLNHQVNLSFLGAGAYQHYIPAIIDHLVHRSEFYTAYTPYQPEISQGILQAIFEYQTFISELFGLPIANASLYDGASALSEALLMAIRETKMKKPFRVLVPETLNPLLSTVIKTYTNHLNLKIELIPARDGIIDPADLASLLQTETTAVVIQNPNFLGLLEDLPELLQIAQNNNTIAICYTHPLTLGILEAPGHLGADIVVAEGQPLGIPLSFGGPYLGLMAVAERFKRSIPGRLVGETVDSLGNRAFVLTLQTREQHIRREKATSNICSNQALCALRAAIYLATLGPVGFREVAQRAFNNAHYLFQKLINIGFHPIFNHPFFMEFSIKTTKPASYYIEHLLKKDILAGFDLHSTCPNLKNSLLICATEVFSKDQLDYFASEMGQLG